MFESTRITGRIRRHNRANNCELFFRITDGLPTPGRAQGLPYPFRDRHPSSLGDMLDLAELSIREKDL
jgi:hypothetical protein